MRFLLSLTAITGWSKLLRIDDSDDAFVREGIAAIDQSAAVQAQLIDDLLDATSNITRPVDPELLTARIGEVLSRRR